MERDREVSDCVVAVAGCGRCNTKETFSVAVRVRDGEDAAGNRFTAGEEAVGDSALTCPLQV